jgi:hypothetical protein
MSSKSRIFAKFISDTAEGSSVDSNGNIIVIGAASVDSNAIISLIDSDYVAARAPASGGGGAAVIAYTYDGTLSVNNGTKRRYISAASTLATADAYVITPSAGTAINLRINKNGSSAGTVSIDSGETSSIDNALNISLAQNDYLTVDITQVGSSTPGSNLYLNLKFS